MHPIRFFSAALGGVLLLGLGQDAVAGGVIRLSSKQLRAVLGERPEVQFLSFTPQATLVIGGVTPYGERAGSGHDASRISWKDGIDANWVEWNPETGTLTPLRERVTPKFFRKEFELRAPTPETWESGDSPRALSRVTLKALAASLGPKAFDPRILAVSPGADFVAVLRYEDKDDGLGAIVFLRAAGNGWARVGKAWEGVSLADPRFSADGRLLLFRYQTNGYDGPEPWALVSTDTAKDRLDKGPDRLAYAVAIDGDRVAVGWSDGEVTVQPLGVKRP